MTCRPIRPKPTMPKTRPLRPFDLPSPYRPFAHDDCLDRVSCATMRRSHARISPIASSATASALAPAQLATLTLAIAAAAISMLSTPAPARTTSSRSLLALIAAAGTLVERTTRRCGEVSARAAWKFTTRNAYLFSRENKYYVIPGYS